MSPVQNILLQKAKNRYMVRAGKNAQSVRTRTVYFYVLHTSWCHQSTIILRDNADIPGARHSNSVDTVCGLQEVYEMFDKCAVICLHVKLAVHAMVLLWILTQTR